MATREQALGALAEQLAGALGIAYGHKPRAEEPRLFWYHEPGLGYGLRQRNPDSSESEPFGSRLRPAGELAATIRFALAALGLAQETGRLIETESVRAALRDAHRNDSAADAVEYVSDLVGWEAGAEEVGA